jgi:hypothetical protein
MAPRRGSCLLPLLQAAGATCPAAIGLDVLIGITNMPVRVKAQAAEPHT